MTQKILGLIFYSLCNKILILNSENIKNSRKFSENYANCIESIKSDNLHEQFQKQFKLNLIKEK